MLQPHGYGIEITCNGCYYEGEWQNGKREGKGTFCFPTGRILEGNFNENKFVQN